MVVLLFCIESVLYKNTIAGFTQDFVFTAFEICGVRLSYDGHTAVFLRPKIQGYTGCKRTGFVKPDSVKLAKGHLLHDEAGP